MSLVLLTGATGLLGRYLLRDLFAAGHAVAVVARSSRQESAVDRIEMIMSRWEREAGRSLPRPIVMEGDLSLPGLGLSPANRSILREQSPRVIHSAASLEFRDTEDGEPTRTNLQGTLHLLELFGDLQVPELHHISTAYVAGMRSGRVFENELDVGQTLCNSYEISKVAAEKLVRASGIPSITVYRPSIIVGDSQTGYTTTYHGFYAPFRATHLMATRLDLGELDLSVLLSALGLRGQECKNFVPVDWCSAALVRIFDEPDLHGATYHLTTPEPFPVGKLIDAGREVFGEMFDPAQALDVRLEDLLPYFREQLQTYEEYWRHDPDFDRTNIEAALPDLPCPKLDAERVNMLVRAAAQANFGWPPERSRPTPQRFSRLFAVNGFQASDAQVTAGEEVGLQITGVDGGWWRGQFCDVGFTNVRPGVPPQNAPLIRISAATIDSIGRGEVSVRDALLTGRIVMLGPNLPLEAAIRVIHSITTAAHEHLIHH